ncbi:MAG: hypothetical protein F6K42_10370, partial [Leptolyngbya sp. SIO1D8]|nr:hypothetical protein [Leptolyngbya sp. SIO1D8]
MDIASGNEDFSILVEAVVKAELVAALSGEGPLTVFAPTNAAFRNLFEALGVQGIEELSREQLTPILLYHVIGANVLSTDLSNGQKAGTLFGNDVTITFQGDHIRVNSSRVIQADISASNGTIHVIDQVLIPAGNIESFTLVNAETDEDIININDGDIIDIASLETTKLNIRANVDLVNTGSIKFELNGAKLRTENLFPYAAFSDSNGDYNEWHPETGDYTLTATPFSFKNARGVEGPVKTISFSVVNSANIVELALQNPNLSILVEAVIKAELVDALSAEGPLTVFAPTNAAFRNLFEALGVQGIEDLSREQLTPILLYHVIGANVLSTDLSNGQKAGTLFGNDIIATFQGAHIRINDSRVIQADVIASNGTVHVIDQVLIPAGNIESFTLINAETDEDIMDINDGDIINIASLETTKLNIRANVDLVNTGSVKFALNGAKLRTENKFPYAAFSDSNGDYNEWHPETTDYTLSATPFSFSNARGVEGPLKTISFTVVNNPNIVQLAQQSPNLSILVEAVIKAGLVDALSAAGPLTVFAPTDAAFHNLFEALGVQGIEDLSSEQLTPILLYHVLNGQILS